MSTQLLSALCYKGVLVEPKIRRPEAGNQVKGIYFGTVLMGGLGRQAGLSGGGLDESQVK